LSVALMWTPTRPAPQPYALLYTANGRQVDHTPTPWCASQTTRPHDRCRGLLPSHRPRAGGDLQAGDPRNSGPTMAVGSQWEGRCTRRPPLVGPPPTPSRDPKAARRARVGFPPTNRAIDSPPSWPDAHTSAAACLRPPDRGPELRHPPPPPQAANHGGGGCRPSPLMGAGASRRRSRLTSAASESPTTPGSRQ